LAFSRFCEELSASEGDPDTVSGCGGILNDDTLHGISRALRDNKPLRGSIHRALNLCTLVTRSDLDPVSGSRPPGCDRQKIARRKMKSVVSVDATKRSKRALHARNDISLNAEYALLAPTGRFIVDGNWQGKPREIYATREIYESRYLRERALFLTNKPVARLGSGRRKVGVIA